jgi:DNA-binding GntR family transcriptional regulator
MDAPVTKVRPSPPKLRPLPAVTSEALRNRSRGAFVYESLRDAIWDGHFVVGDRMTEEEIAHMLGVSRTPVREALQRLQERGLLAVGAGRTLVVAGLSKQQVFELYAMREILEGSAARFAAQYATAGEIEMLRRLLAEFSRHHDDPRMLVSLNRRFHRAVCEAAHNRYLIETLDSLHDSLTLLNGSTFRVPPRPSRTDAEHRKIVRAIERRDSNAAEKAARDHVRQAQRTRFDVLGD